MDIRPIEMCKIIRPVALIAALLFMLRAGAAADAPAEVTYPQISEAACPLKVVSIPGKAGNEVTAVVRQPPGNGPFPAIVLLHDASGAGERFDADHYALSAAIQSSTADRRRHRGLSQPVAPRARAGQDGPAGVD